MIIYASGDYNFNISVEIIIRIVKRKIEWKLFRVLRAERAKELGRKSKWENLERFVLI